MDTDSVDDTVVMKNDSSSGIDDISNAKGRQDDVSQYEVIQEVDIEAISTKKGTPENVPSEKEMTQEVCVKSISTDKGTPQSSETEVIQEVGIALIRLELDIACCSEKLVDINLLMMLLVAKESDFEVFALDKDDTSFDSEEEAIEFDILSGIFDLEVKEIDCFIDELETDINNTSETISSHKHLGGAFLALEEKLLDAGKSIKQLQEQVSELMMQSAKFQMILSSLNQEETSDEDKEAISSWVGDFFNKTTKLKMRTSKQQQHVLRMLEKSLARELELGNELKEYIQSLNKMKNELGFSQQEVLAAKEETAAIYALFLEADSASIVFMGISKELISKLQLCQFKMNSAFHHENEINRRLQECTQILQDLEKKEVAMHEITEKNSSEASALKEKVNFLEEQLTTSESSLMNGIASLDGNSEGHEIKELEDRVSIAESRAEKAEAESKILAEANKKLNDELNILKNSGVTIEKVDSLEKQLRETNVQLQEAMSSIEASQEQQTMLYSTSDMEIFIEKLKLKVSEANARADSAEDKCIILSEGYVELNEEVNSLKGKLEYLEASLQQAEETKWATAKDVNFRSKMITDMAMQLAVERGRLDKQLTLLMMENRTLVSKLCLANKVSSNLANHQGGETEGENEEDSDATEIEMSPDDTFGSDGKLEPQNRVQA